MDPVLGPEMRSTGEVMGVGINFGEAFLKAQISAGSPLPEKGTVFLSVNDRHKVEAVEVARRFTELGFRLARAPPPPPTPSQRECATPSGSGACKRFTPRPWRNAG